jgi:hypothetical protein
MFTKNTVRKKDIFQVARFIHIIFTTSLLRFNNELFESVVALELYEPRVCNRP